MKKQNKENFFLNSQFLYENQAVNIYSQQSHYKKIEYKLIIEPNYAVAKIKFAYQATNGLVRLNENGSIAENNILGKFLKIRKICNNKKRLNSYIDFFNDNGFILTINTKEEYGLEDLDLIVDELFYTVNLMSLIASNKKTKYEELIKEIEFLLNINEDRINEYWSIINGENIGNFYNINTNDIYDDIYKCATHIDLNTLIDISSKATEYNDLYKISSFNKSFMPYISPRINDSKWYIWICFNVNYYLNLHNKKEEPLDQPLKEGLIVIAKLLYKEQIDYYIQNIKPVYDINKFSPSWEITSLLSSLYLSIFYLNPKLQIYKECEYCGELFLMKATSTYKKYCSRECSNKANVARYRARKKEPLFNYGLRCFLHN